METTINRNLLLHAVGRAITCPQCASRHVLDAPASVLVTLTPTTSDPALNTTREYVMCGQYWDTVKHAMFDIWGSQVSVLDGRELFPAPATSRRKPRPRPQTAHKRTDPYTGPFPRKRHSHRCKGCEAHGQYNAVAFYKQRCTCPQLTEACSWCRREVK
jgi:hypothetical protein